ncbi:MAG: hypothetical protein Q9193_004525 [Seirophora villosa]
MSSARPRLSLLKYLELGLVLVEAYWSAALVLILAPVSGDKGHLDFMTCLNLAVAKTQNEKLPARQLQTAFPPRADSSFDVHQRVEMAQSTDRRS